MLRMGFHIWEWRIDWWYPCHNSSPPPSERHGRSGSGKNEWPDTPRTETWLNNKIILWRNKKKLPIRWVVTENNIESIDAVDCFRIHVRINIFQKVFKTFCIQGGHTLNGSLDSFSLPHHLNKVIISVNYNDHYELPFRQIAACQNSVPSWYKYFFRHHRQIHIDQYFWKYVCLIGQK